MSDIGPESMDINRVNARVSEHDARPIHSVDDILPAQFRTPHEVTFGTRIDVLANSDTAEFVHWGLRQLGLSASDIAANPELDAVTEGLAKLHTIRKNDKEK